MRVAPGANGDGVPSAHAVAVGSEVGKNMPPLPCQRLVLGKFPWLGGSQPSLRRVFLARVFQYNPGMAYQTRPSTRETGMPLKDHFRLPRGEPPHGESLGSDAR